MLMPDPVASVLPPQNLSFVGVGSQTVPAPISQGLDDIALNAGDIDLHRVTTLGVDVNVAGLVGGNLRVIVERKGLDGQYYMVFTTGATGGPADISANGQNGYSIGLSLAGANSVFLGRWIRIRVVALTGVTAATVTVSAQGA